MTKRQNLLIHLFDREVLDLDEVYRRHDPGTVELDFLLALKIGCLFCTGRLLLPLSSYFESSVGSAFVSGAGPLFAAQELELVSSELDYEQFVELKREQYKREPGRHPAYFDKRVLSSLRDLHPPVVLRTVSSTNEIATGWRAHFSNNPSLNSALGALRSTKSIVQFERRLIELPERLGSDAFIWDYVKPLLPVSGVARGDAAAIKSLISRCYVRSYLDEFEAYAICDLKVGSFRCGLSANELVSMRLLRQALRLSGLLDALERLSWTDIVALKYDPAFIVFASQLRSFVIESALSASVTQALIASRRKVERVDSLDDIRKCITFLVHECSLVGQGERPAISSSLSNFGRIWRKSECDALLQRLLSIQPGSEGAHDYENAIEALITALFSPILLDPSSQVKIHGGRKRIDLTYRNMAHYGFFLWLARHYRAPYIFVECKNYATEIGNPELDQLAGRFSTSRGQVGLLVCRTIQDKDKLLKSCQDTAADQRGYIIPLEDRDFEKLVEAKAGGIEFFDAPILKARFDSLQFHSIQS